MASVGCESRQVRSRRNQSEISIKVCARTSRKGKTMGGIITFQNDPTAEVLDEMLRQCTDPMGKETEEWCQSHRPCVDYGV